MVAFAGKVSVRGGVSAVALSVDHTPMDPREAGRVIAGGVRLMMRLLIKPMLPALTCWWLRVVVD